MKHLWIISLVIWLPVSQLSAAQMIATDRVIEAVESERAQVEAFFARGDVEKKMVELGVSPSEARIRVASLSDTEVRTVAGKLKELKAGGDGIYIGLGTLLVVLILVLLLR